MSETNTKRYRIVRDHTGRWGIIDQGKLPLIGQWCHVATQSLSGAMNWIAKQP
jgi:hypothetical protein